MQKGQSQVLFCVRNFRQSADYYIAECLPIGIYVRQCARFQHFSTFCTNRLRKMLRLRKNNINKNKGVINYGLRNQKIMNCNVDSGRIAHIKHRLANALRFNAKTTK